MNDEIVEEIHQIRERLYEETKEMSLEERQRRTRAASRWVQERIVEQRAEKHGGVFWAKTLGETR